MNYTYLPSTPYSSSPIVIMTTPASSRKTDNLESNSRVSLLVHDWISHRPPTLSQPGRSPSLLGMNTASLSRISATINGVAELVPSGSDEEKWYKTQHVANNTFGPSEDEAQSGSLMQGGLWGSGNGVARDDDTVEGDGGTKWYVEGEEVRVVVVKIRDGRISDWKGQVRDWTLETDDAAAGINGTLA
jgi:hypothetical protein